jgi:hypothetical protein
MSADAIREIGNIVVTLGFFAFGIVVIWLISRD